MAGNCFKFCISEFVVDRDSCSDFVGYIFAMPFQISVHAMPSYTQNSSKNWCSHWDIAK